MGSEIPMTMSEFTREQENNDSKAAKILQGMFPDLFTDDYIDVLMKVRNGMDVIKEKTGQGEVIVHISPSRISVEFRGRYQSKSKSLDSKDTLSYYSSTPETDTVD